jgi:hypothetical protein
MILAGHYIALLSTAGIHTVAILTIILALASCLILADCFLISRLFLERSVYQRNPLTFHLDWRPRTLISLGSPC